MRGDNLLLDRQLRLGLNTLGERGPQSDSVFTGKEFHILCPLRHHETLHGDYGQVHNGPDAGGVHEAVAEGVEEEARPRTEAATEELKAEGDFDPEAVPGHLQDPDATVQGSERPGN